MIHEISFSLSHLPKKEGEGNKQQSKGITKRATLLYFFNTFTHSVIQQTFI